LVVNHSYVDQSDLCSLVRYVCEYIEDKFEKVTSYLRTYT
jgi:hypothetical protein